MVNRRSVIKKLLSLTVAALIVLPGFIPLPAAADGSNPRMIADINPGSGSGCCGPEVTINGTTFFDGAGSDYDYELWKTDGTTAGTVEVKDINPGPYPATSEPGDFVNLNGILIFNADDGVHGKELWRSDGTEAGTYMVKDIDPGSDSGWPAFVSVINGVAYGAASDGQHGFELWRTDGTAAGTYMVKDFNPGSGDSWTWSYDPDVAKVNGIAYFAASQNDNGTADLWKTDGTEAGTVQVTSGINVQSGVSYINGAIFFQADDGVHGPELWKSDGTSAGTVLVKDIHPGSVGSYPGGFIVLNGITYFVASLDEGVSNNMQLWKTDGTAAGTVQVSSSFNSFESQLVLANGNLYFLADPLPARSGHELWRSDGTEGGTVRVKVIDPTNENWSPYGFAYMHGMLFFSVTDSVHGYELWQSDGTGPGTAMVSDINPGSASSYARDLHDTGSGLMFDADDGIHGNEPWILDYPSIAAPANLTAASPTNLPVLGWSSVTGADHYNIYRDGILIGSTSATSYTDNSSVTEGSHIYGVSAVNLSGNESYKSGISVTVDQTAPTLGLPSWTNNPATTNQTPSVTIPVSDNLSGVTSGEYYLGTTDPGQGSGTAMTLSNGNLSASISNLTPNIYTVNFRAKDNAGNWSPVTTDYLVVYDATQTSADGHSNRIIPVYGTDILPGLIQAGQTDAASFAFTVKYNQNTLVSASKVHFAYSTGTHCNNPSQATNCHNTTLDSTSIDWMVVNGTNNSLATMQGTATLTIDGVTTTNPFRVVATDGGKLTPATNDQFEIDIYAPGANPNNAQPIYHMNEAVTYGNVVVQR